MGRTGFAGAIAPRMEQAVSVALTDRGRSFRTGRSVSIYTEDGGRSIMDWHDIIALAIGVPALTAYVWFVKDVTPTEAPKRGVSRSALLVLGSIWRSGGRS